MPSLNCSSLLAAAISLHVPLASSCPQILDFGPIITGPIRELTALFSLLPRLESAAITIFDYANVLYFERFANPMSYRSNVAIFAAV